MISPLLVYVFGPPLAALVFCGLICIGSNRRTAALDRDIAAYRRQRAAETEKQRQRLALVNDK